MENTKHPTAAVWLAIAVLITGWFTVSLLSPPATWADRPPTKVGGVEGSTDPGPPPLTPEQEASLQTKLAQVER